LKHYDFEAGEVLLFNKPLHWTSFQLVKKVRYLTRAKKVGHAGTLDPLATGLLILCTGKATKQIESYMGQDKEYTGCFRLGESSPSYDRETESDAHYPTNHLTTADLEKVRDSLTGVLQQYPPAHSAIKVDGQRLYKNARKGISQEIKARTVEVSEFELTRVEMPDVYFRVKCGKGTYIRSLVHDFGQALGNGAVLTELCRTAIGSYRLSDAWEIQDFEQMIKARKAAQQDDTQA